MFVDISSVLVYDPWPWALDSTGCCWIWALLLTSECVSKNQLHLGAQVSNIDIL